MTSITPNGEVEFRFYRKNAQRVVIVGDFAPSQTGGIPMEPSTNGWWELRMKVPGGEHHFRYLADEQWYTDFASHGVEFAKNHWHSVLLVPEAPQTPSQSTQNKKLAA